MRGGLLRRVCGRALCPAATLGRAAAARPLGRRPFSDWAKSATLGKSSVTKELWRRRQTENGDEVQDTHAVLYRFSTDPLLRDEYVGNTGHLLTGRLLEDLDALAGNAAVDWCSGLASSDGSPLSLVTAAVSDIRLKRPLFLATDMTLTGRVVYTGRSSMMVSIKMLAGGEVGAGEELVEADFVYVARDAATGKGVAVRPLVATTPEAEAMVDAARKKMAARKTMRGRAALAGPAIGDHEVMTRAILEGLSLHDLPAMQATRTGKILMRDTALSNTTLTKPQDRNTGGAVFGGFLMRVCYEHAFVTAFAFVGRDPKCKEVSEFVFERPVKTGSIVRLSSRVLLTMGTRCLVEVVVRVLRPTLGETWCVNRIMVIFESGGWLPEVLPLTGAEARLQAEATEIMARCP